MVNIQPQFILEETRLATLQFDNRLVGLLTGVGRSLLFDSTHAQTVLMYGLVTYSVLCVSIASLLSIRTYVILYTQGNELNIPGRFGLWVSAGRQQYSNMLASA